MKRCKRESFSAKAYFESKIVLFDIRTDVFLILYYFTITFKYKDRTTVY